MVSSEDGCTQSSRERLVAVKRKFVTTVRTYTNQDPRCASLPRRRRPRRYRIVRISFRLAEDGSETSQ